MLPHNLLPPEYMKNAFIAGGYAACPALAHDIDVWVTVPIHKLDEARSDILRHLAEQDTFAVEEQDANPPVPADRFLSTEMPDGYSILIAKRRVGIVSYYRSAADRPFHIIVTEGDVDQVLGSFDISTHQVALTPAGVVMGEYWTPTNVRPRVLRNTTTTPARVRKISERFGHEVEEIPEPVEELF